MKDFNIGDEVYIFEWDKHGKISSKPITNTSMFGNTFTYIGVTYEDGKEVFPMLMFVEKIER